MKQTKNNIMKVGKAYKTKRGHWELLVGIIDLGMLGKSPNIVTGQGTPHKKFESKEEAEKYWEENKEQFK